MRKAFLFSLLSTVALAAETGAGTASNAAATKPAAPAKPPEKQAAKPKRAAGADRNAPIPDAVADGTMPGDAQAEKLGKEIPDLAALGKAFVKPLPDDARSGTFRPKGDDDWTSRPIALADGWHHDEGTKWNFLIQGSRLFEAKSDEAMANQPAGTHGRTFRT